MTTATLSQFTQNGFTYAPIETVRDQRKKRLLTEIKTKKALSMGEIKKICGYGSMQGARNFANDLAFLNPKIFCIHPPKNEKKFKTEAQKLVL